MIAPLPTDLKFHHWDKHDYLESSPSVSVAPCGLGSQGSSCEHFYQAGSPSDSLSEAYAPDRLEKLLHLLEGTFPLNSRLKKSHPSFELQLESTFSGPSLDTLPLSFVVLAPWRHLRCLAFDESEAETKSCSGQICSLALPLAERDLEKIIFPCYVIFFPTTKGCN